tara:strand:+ start:756 stop:890 length:135 start_codon:yes stop_codon:yes gene_type:complete
METRMPDGEGGTRTVKYDVPLVSLYSAFYGYFAVEGANVVNFKR